MLSGVRAENPDWWTKDPDSWNSCIRECCTGQAQYATTTAVWISYLIAASNALIGILSLACRRPVLGLDGRVLLDAGLFAVVGWRITRLSRAWSVVGISLYVLEVLISIVTRGHGVGLPILAILFFIVYLNALRGTFAYHKYAKLQAAQPTE